MPTVPQADGRSPCSFAGPARLLLLVLLICLAVPPAAGATAYCVTAVWSESSDGAPGQLGMLWGIAAGPDGTVYLGEGAGEIDVYTPAGVRTGGWTMTDMHGELIGANAIAVGPDGTIAVLQPGSTFAYPVIATYRADGTQIGCWSPPDLWETEPLFSYRNPAGIAVGPDGNVYMVDSKLQWVERYSPTGTSLARIGWWKGDPYSDPNGGQPGHQSYLTEPRDVAFDTNGSMLVTDPGANLVHRFSASGQYICSLSGTSHAKVAEIAKDAEGNTAVLSGTGLDRWLTVYADDDYYRTGHTLADFGGDPGEVPYGAQNLSDPRGVAINREGSAVYVADDGYHRVQKYDLHGNLLDTWGDLPWESPGGTFRNPYGVVVGKDGTVYVGDANNYRVQHFARNGAFLEAWGRLGTLAEPGTFTSVPWNLAVDTAGNVLVADLARVQTFSPNGTYLSSLNGTAGIGYNAHAVAVGPDGTILVTEYLKARVHVYSPAGVHQSSWGEAGNETGKFRSQVSDIAFTPSGEVLASDPYRVQRFTKNGAYLEPFASFPTKATGAANYYDRNLAVGPDGTVAATGYVLDDDRIVVMDASGNTVATMNQSSWTHLGTASDLAIDGQGRIYATRSGANDIYVFDPVASVLAVPGASSPARDLNGDGKYEDVNGNGRKDFADVTLYFNQMAWIGAHEPLAAFDYNGNGRIDFADIAWLFGRL
jgi:PKD repeat protein